MLSNQGKKFFTKVGVDTGFSGTGQAQSSLSRSQSSCNCDKVNHQSLPKFRGSAAAPAVHWQTKIKSLSSGLWPLPKKEFSRTLGAYCPAY
eukprot:2005809-Rhodomonas_salina.1